MGAQPRAVDKVEGAWDDCLLLVYACVGVRACLCCVWQEEKADDSWDDDWGEDTSEDAVAARKAALAGGQAADEQEDKVCVCVALVSRWRWVCLRAQGKGIQFLSPCQKQSQHALAMRKKTIVLCLAAAFEVSRLFHYGGCID